MVRGVRRTSPPRTVANTSSEACANMAFPTDVQYSGSLPPTRDGASAQEAAHAALGIHRSGTGV